MAHTDRLLRLLNSVSYRGATAIALHPARQKMTHFTFGGPAFAVTHDTRNDSMRSLASLPLLRSLELRQAA
jgi:hypothetical protein